MTDWLRSRRPGNGVEVNALETRFAARHHPLTLVEAKMEPPDRSGKRRQIATTNLPPFVAHSCRNLPPLVAILMMDALLLNFVRLSCPPNIRRWSGGSPPVRPLQSPGSCPAKVRRLAGESPGDVQAAARNI